jgi:hypothetical protein
MGLREKNMMVSQDLLPRTAPAFPVLSAGPEANISGDCFLKLKMTTERTSRDLGVIYGVLVLSGVKLHFLPLVMLNAEGLPQ